MFSRVHAASLRPSASRAVARAFAAVPRTAVAASAPRAVFALPRLRAASGTSNPVPAPGIDEKWNDEVAWRLMQASKGVRSGEDVETMRRRCHVMSRQRGWRETDLICRHWADKFIYDLDAEGVKQFDAILMETDGVLYDWLTGKAELPAEHQNATMDSLRAFTASNFSNYEVTNCKFENDKPPTVLPTSRVDGPGWHD